MSNSEDSQVDLSFLSRARVPLYKEHEGKSLLSVMKSLVQTEAAKKAADSAQGTQTGVRPHLYNYDAIYQMLEANVHHSACIRAKVSSSVGLGFQSEADRLRKDANRQGMPMETTPTADQEVAKIDTVLDPFCAHSFQDVITSVAQDYWLTGNGYMEVVREGQTDDSPISGLHHLRSADVHIVVEDPAGVNFHYEILRDESGGSRAFAKIGDLESFLSEERKGSLVGGVTRNDQTKFTEVIHFKQPSAMDRWYGVQDWTAAVASIELVQMLHQHEFDFFLNRGVPEFMLFLLGCDLAPTDKAKIETAMQATIGLGNAHKTLLLTLSNPEAKVQLEKLAMESKSDGSQFSGMTDTLATQIVSAHGTPPLLAGIQIPGKLGANNELVQAMQSFHSLVVHPAQRIFMQRLRKTLGNPQCNGGLDLSSEDFVLNTIVDEVDLESLDTVSRMRQSPQEAAAEGRDINDGLKD